MKNKYPKFLSKQHLTELVEDYFNKVNQNLSDSKLSKSKTIQDIPVDEMSNKELCGPPTIAGLAFYLGFTSREQFGSYESNGKFADDLKRARLRIEDVYERKLHQQPSGAIFALKTLGWNEKSETKKPVSTATKTMRIVIVEAGPKPATSEKEVNI